MKTDFTLPPDKGPINGNVTITGLDLRGLGAHAPMFKRRARMCRCWWIWRNSSSRRAVTLGSADFDIAAAGQIPFAAMKDKALHVTACGWPAAMTASKIIWP